MQPELENDLLRKAGYSENVIKTYRFLKDSNWRAFNGEALAEAFLVMLDIEKEKGAT